MWFLEDMRSAGLRKAQLEKAKVSGVRRQAADELRTHGRIQAFQCPRNAYARRLGKYVLFGNKK
jgi:hypothetical protein